MANDTVLRGGYKISHAFFNFLEDNQTPQGYPDLFVDFRSIVLKAGII